MSKIQISTRRSLTPVNDALRIFLDQFQKGSLGSETIQADNALGRVVSEDIIATMNLPQYDRAAMDGYAIRSIDTSSASETNPVTLEVVGNVAMGSVPNLVLSPGQTVTVATGALLPRSANAVLMLEFSRKAGRSKISAMRTIAPGEHVARIGEDVVKGCTVLKRGLRLRPQDLGIIAALGKTEVRVFRRPTVACLSTGNEIVRPKRKLSPGEVYDINGPVIRAMVCEIGCEPIDLGVVPDERKALREKLLAGLHAADVTLVSGGTSVGERDIVPEVVSSLGNPGVIIHGVKMRPGSPVGLACVDGKAIVLLSGYPVAAMMAFRVFVRPLLTYLQSSMQESDPKVKARLLTGVRSQKGIRTFARVRLKKVRDGFVADLIQRSGAGIISSMTESDGLLVIPEIEEEYEKGKEVEIILLRPLEP
tara:strand:+ start:94 stop:1359 length:1266 start_codon:yes stop_codon:yes gene_type:complete